MGHVEDSLGDRLAHLPMGNTRSAVGQKLLAGGGFRSALARAVVSGLVVGDCVGLHGLLLHFLLRGLENVAGGLENRRTEVDIGHERVAGLVNGLRRTLLPLRLLGLREEVVERVRGHKMLPLALVVSRKTLERDFFLDVLLEEASCEGRLLRQIVAFSSGVDHGIGEDFVGRKRVARGGRAVEAGAAGLLLPKGVCVRCAEDIVLRRLQSLDLNG